MSDAISTTSLRRQAQWLRDQLCYAEADAMDDAAEEIDRLRAELDEADALRQRLASLLHYGVGTTLPEKAQAVMGEIDRLRTLLALIERANPTLIGRAKVGAQS